MNSTKQIKNQLLHYNIKPSLHRMEVLKYLLKYKNHPTVDMVFNELHPSIPTLSKTTVYNTLKLLEESGAIQSLNIDEKNVRYDADLSSHAHFRCKTCGKIYDISLEEEKIIQQSNIKQSVLFQITECQVYYKGYCKDCLTD